MIKKAMLVVGLIKKDSNIILICPKPNYHFFWLCNTKLEKKNVFLTVERGKNLAVRNKPASKHAQRLKGMLSNFFLHSSSPQFEKKYIMLLYINIPELHFFRFYITVRLSLFAFRSLNGKLVVSILCLFWSWRLLYLLLTPMLVSYYQNHNIFS